LALKVFEDFRSKKIEPYQSDLLSSIGRSEGKNSLNFLKSWDRAARVDIIVFLTSFVPDFSRQW
jgi:hypothetical protein